MAWKAEPSCMPYTEKKLVAIRPYLLAAVMALPRVTAPQARV